MKHITIILSIITLIATFNIIYNFISIAKGSKKALKKNFLLPELTIQNNNKHSSIKMNADFMSVVNAKQANSGTHRNESYFLNSAKDNAETYHKLYEKALLKFKS